LIRRALLAALLCAGLGPVPETLRSNAGVARDLLDLSFRWEDGRPLPAFSRFDGPVRVRVEDAALVPEARALLARLRAEGGIDVRLATGAAEIVVESAAAMPEGTSCYVVPGEDWSADPSRRSARVVVPAGAPADVRRDCLHEELAQALGPVGDLWRLSDSVFNDDNVQGALTAFDMLVLRATYALPVGASQAEVEAALPAVLARLNPAGELGGIDGAAPSPAWEAAIARALLDRDEGAAREALALAPEGAQRGLALAALARLEGSAAAWRAAAEAFALTPLARRHRALADAQAVRLDGAAQPG
jgi:hypothetical protein